MANNNQYYIAFEGDIFGPYTLHEVFGLGVLPNTLISHSGTDWARAYEFPELRSLFQTNTITREGVHRNTIHDSRALIYRQKRKTAIIGVVTLGLAGLSLIGIGEAWRSNIFAGTSLDRGGLGFAMKIISFMIVSVLFAVPFFIISTIQLIYYSIRLHLTN